jgi:hypothetical protein
MHEALGEVVAARVGDAELRDRVQRVALLRAASAIAALDFGDTFGAAILGHGSLRFELLVERWTEPAVEHPVTHGHQRFVAGRVTDRGEHRECPVRAAPVCVQVFVADEAFVAAGEQCLDAWRSPNLFL